MGPPPPAIRRRPVTAPAWAAIRTLAVTAALSAAIAFVATPATASSGPRLQLRAAALIDARSGQSLFGTNANRRSAIASTTKLMTALVTLEHVRNLNQQFADPPFYFPPIDSQIALTPGERMSVHDLMIAMMLPSADDAADDLAYNVGHRSVARFVGMMNARARQLHLTHTHYATPVGLDTAGNYSSASDLVALARYVLAKEPFFRLVVGLRSAVLHTGNHRRVVVNRNDLVVRYRWIHGVKTGYTADAGYVLVGSGTKGGMTLISAVLGTSSESARDANTLALLNWGFSNFRLRTPVRARTVQARLPVQGEPQTKAILIAASTYTAVFPKGTKFHFRKRLPRQLVGPIARHTPIGSITIFAGRRPVARVPLLLARALPAPPPPATAAAFITAPFTLLFVGVVIGAGASFIVLRRRRTKRGGGAGPEPG